MSHYNHLTIFERERIYLLTNQGFSIRKIAQTIHRSPSTISRELKRNTRKESYSPSTAQSFYSLRKQRCGRKLLLSNPALWKVVRKLFVEQQWSPEEISFRIKLENTLRSFYNIVLHLI